MGSGCDSLGWGLRSNRSLSSLLCHCNGGWNISPKRLRMPWCWSTDDELTALRNYRWSILKTHTVFTHSSTHLHISTCKWLIIYITDINFISSFLSLPSDTYTHLDTHTHFLMYANDWSRSLADAGIIIAFIYSTVLSGSWPLAIAYQIVF